MGMAASQARLLTLTARLSDNELRSQTINNAKMRLAAQSSQASEAYINALNNATLKFTNYDETGAAHIQPLTYNALTAYSAYNTQYGITNTSGQLLVSEEEAKMFQNANGDLNKYLKAHGLEYTTTYFEKIKNKEQPDYPEPFNYITTDQLQNWYESYGSYENSVEVENYQKAYGNYNAARNALYHGLKSPLDQYFGEQNSTTERIPGGYTYNDTLNPTNDKNITARGIAYNNLVALKEAYATSSNPYSYTNPNTAKFVNGIPDGMTSEKIKELLNNYQFEGSSPNYTDLKVTTTTEINKNADGTSSFQMGDVTITMDKDNRVTNVRFENASTSDTEDPGKPSGVKYSYLGAEQDLEDEWIPPKDAEGKYPTIEDFLTKFKVYDYDIADDNTATKISTISDGKFDKEKMTVTMNERFVEDNAIKDQIKYLNEELLSKLKEQTDYAKFGKYLIDNNININSGIKELIDEHTKRKTEFLNLIFKDIDTVKYQFPYETEDPATKKPITKYTSAMSVNDAIEAGYIKMADLMDEEYVLWLAKNTKTATGEALNEENTFMTETFKTVMKSYIVEQVIEETGTPKYAWVDATDTTNKGNADAKAQWYTNLFKRMQQGYKALENGLASSSQWLEYAIESGIVLLEQVDKSFNWQSLEFKTCTRITEETDDAAVAKAEAEYTRAMNDIKSKDNMYDIQLKNIDTEHNSLQTEYDSIKKVMDKNIDRTFKFSQNG